MKILAVFTCFNRKDKTKECIYTITKGNPNCDFTFVVVDDGSTDGTYEMLNVMQKQYDIHCIRGNGNLYYSGGMRTAMSYIIENKIKQFDYLLMMNDDVLFYPNSIEQILEESRLKANAVIVGTTQGSDGKLSYGAIKYIKGLHYKKCDISESDINVDTFNANCVLVPFKIFLEIGTIDNMYTHSLGDFDYGLAIKKKGYKLYPSTQYVGLCDNNSLSGTWQDTSLTMRQRIKKKESVKGAPTKQWFYFLKKNFGLCIAIKGSITPYIRILLGK